MHLKRQRVPKNWPVYRKGTKYIVRPGFTANEGIPVLIALRDILRVVQNRKEAKKIIFMKQILLNARPVKDEKMPVLLFDTLSLSPLNKSYRLDLSEKGKFEFTEIKANEIDKKVSKIINKKMIKGKKVQLNLSDGRNFLSDIQCKVNDSALIDLKNRKIEKCIPMKENANVIVFAGKHSGRKGKIKKMDKEKNILEVDTGKEKINVLFKQAMVTE